VRIKLTLEHRVDDLEEHIGPVMWDARALATLWHRALAEMAQLADAGHDQTFLKRVDAECSRLARIATAQS
jgi:hypothetical protein